MGVWGGRKGEVGEADWGRKKGIEQKWQAEGAAFTQSFWFTIGCSRSSCGPGNPRLWARSVSQVCEPGLLWDQLQKPSWIVGSNPVKVQILLGFFLIFIFTSLRFSPKTGVLERQLYYVKVLLWWLLWWLDMFTVELLINWYWLNRNLMGDFTDFQQLFWLFHQHIQAPNLFVKMFCNLVWLSEDSIQSGRRDYLQTFHRLVCWDQNTNDLLISVQQKYKGKYKA